MRKIIFFTFILPTIYLLLLVVSYSKTFVKPVEYVIDDTQFVEYILDTNKDDKLVKYLQKIDYNLVKMVNVNGIINFELYSDKKINKNYLKQVAIDLSKLSDQPVRVLMINRYNKEKVDYIVDTDLTITKY